MAKTYLALGSNLGNRAQYLRQAIRALSRDNLILAISPIYETAPMGGPPQADYLNQVIVLETAWTPFELLRRCQVIEQEAGRQRIIQDGPRTLDIDIVLYERQMFSSSTLTIPHPRLGSRRFVLEPLYRIDPALTLPTGQRIESLWRQVQDQSVRLWSNDGSAKDADFIAAASRLTDFLIAADSLDSTNSELRRLWAQGDAEDGMAVVAEQQTEGRGRLGRQWISPKGSGLYVSVLVQPQRAMDPLLGFAAAVALSETVSAVTGIKPGIKWPNDGVIMGKKYAGILVEASKTPRPHAIVGVGVNVHGSFGNAVPTATTLDQATEPLRVDRTVLLDQFLRRLAYWTGIWQQARNAEILANWRVFHVLPGAFVQIWQNDMALMQGRVKDVDRYGHLILDTEGGHTHRVTAGEVSVRLADGGYAPMPH